MAEALLLGQNGKPRRTFVLRGLFTLAAIYSRGTCRPTTIDVLMFHFRVRNGSGWGHQAMTTRFQEAVRLLCLSGNLFCGGISIFSAAGWHPRGLFCVFCVVLSLSVTFLNQAEIACHRGDCIRSVGC